MVNIQQQTIIDLFAELLGITRNNDLDIILIVLCSIVIFFILDSVLRVFLTLLFEPFKQ